MKKNNAQKQEQKKRSEASKKGWVTRRLHEGKTRTRKIPSEKLKKLQRAEKLRNASRRKAQKIGRSIATDKPKLNIKKPTRPARRPSKKRVSVR